MPKRTTSYEAGLFRELQDPLAAAHYLKAASEDSNSPQMFLIALRDVADARKFSKVAESAGVERESVYRMLSADGNPTYNSLVGILQAVGLRLSVVPLEASGGGRTFTEIAQEDVPVTMSAQDSQVYRSGVTSSVAALLLGTGYTPEQPIDLPGTRLTLSELANLGSVTENFGKVQQAKNQLRRAA